MRLKRFNGGAGSAMAAGVLAVAMAAGVAKGQVQVNSGETLTEADLSSGMFTGAAGKFNFSLAPSTFFDINQGGRATGGDFGGSTLNVNDGGILEGHFKDVIANIRDGGSVVKGDFSGSSFGGIVNFFQGSSASGLINNGGAINVMGGTVEGIEFGSVRVTGGTVNSIRGSGDSIFAEIEGGFVGGISTQGGGRINVKGGRVGGITAPTTFTTPTVRITGGIVDKLDADGVIIDGGHIGLARNVVELRGGSIADARLNSINMSGGVIQDLLPREFGVLSGGEIGTATIRGEHSGTSVQLSGANIQNEVFFDNMQVDMSAGTVGGDVEVFNSDIHVSGGVVEGDIELISVDGVTSFRVSGGNVGGIITTLRDREFDSLFDLTVHLDVRSLTIDEDVVDLSLDETIEIDQRGGALLEATLADGSFFDLRLNDTRIVGEDFLDQLATLTVTRVVPTPGSAGLLGMAGLVASRRRRG